jgi:hypothetical protein
VLLAMHAPASELEKSMAFDIFHFYYGIFN